MSLHKIGEGIVFGARFAAPVELHEWCLHQPGQPNLTFSLNLEGLGLFQLNRNTNLYDVEPFYDLHDLQRTSDLSIEAYHNRVSSAYHSFARLQRSSESCRSSIPATKQVWTLHFQGWRQSLVIAHFLFNDVTFN